MSTARSNIRVFVTFKESTVFAGEDVEATITFKNVEIKRPKPQRPGLAIVQANGTATPSVAPSQPSQPVSKAALSRAPSVASNVKKPAHLTASRHRPAISLNIVDSASTRPRGPGSTTGGVNIAEPSPGTPKHGRSVSIVSLGSEASRGERLRGSQPSHTPSRPGFKHGRSASVQVSSPSQRIGRSPSLSGRSTFASPLSGVASPRYRSAESYFLQRPDQNQGSLVETPPVLPSPRGQLQQGFQFPPASKRPLPHRNATISAIGHARSNTSSPRPSSPAVRESRDPTRLDSGHLNRVLSLSSEDGTPRSSGDFYSLSNRSDETLASEYQTQPSSRLLQRPPFSRSPSNLNPTPASKVPETLMMGYVQMSGSFVLDGSLVNPAPFEEVKRKAVVGGQGGGGVVGIEQKKSDGGLFGSFGWGNIGESLGGLLRGGEQSSIKEMKSIATSKSIPLLSTPKSILFVDLKLAPGQSRSYSYSFALPRGLPPSHRGRAIKVSYHLIIGTQRPSASKTQQIRQVEIPFRVFSGVNAEGDTLGHDLMTPYIILQDKAKTSSLDQLTAPIIREPAPPPSALASSSEVDFASYINRLLTTARDPDTNTLLSPTAENEDLSLSPSITLNHTFAARSPSAGPLPSARALIDHAMRLAASPATGLPTSFTIARSSHTIATLTLSRPALRLGDTLHLALDFSNAAIPCYSIDASLETQESIDSSLAIRSAASVERATRRVWDKRAEPGFALGWCGRWGGRLKVPWNATPGFETTGVSCKWVVRVEIVVGVDRSAPEPSLPPDDEDVSSANDDDASSDADSEPALERGETHALAPGTGATPPPPPGTRRRSSSSARRRSAQLSRAARNKAKVVDRAKLLLDDVGADERGRHLAAKQRLLCESFDVCVPLRVFGASGAATGRSLDGGGGGGGGGGDGAVGAGGEEGLAI